MRLRSAFYVIGNFEKKDNVTIAICGTYEEALEVVNETASAYDYYTIEKRFTKRRFE